jgi:ectoine hydroxylase-related dioxygenase (phytanoyl-CoA dioxygenase family)
MKRFKCNRMPGLWHAGAYLDLKSSLPTLVPPSAQNGAMTTSRQPLRLLLPVCKSDIVNLAWWRSGPRFIVPQIAPEEEHGLKHKKLEAMPPGVAGGSVSASDIAQFREQGYLVLRGALSKVAHLAKLRQEITDLGRMFVPDFRMDDDSYQRFGAANQSRFYTGLRYLPSLTMLASCDELVECSRQLGLAMPAVMHSYNIRMDVPADTKVLFHWHQDISYLLGSLNSVTYWLPLGRANVDHGSIEVIPKSHRSGLAPVRYTGEGTPPKAQSLSPKDLYLMEDPKEAGPVVDVDFGDMVVFSQFLLHRSTANLAKKVRWTIQVRHSDLAEDAFISAGYPLGDRTNLYHTQYLSEGGQNG